VVGISGDTAKTQGLFKKQHDLNFTLLGDEKGAVAKLFGVPTKPGGEITTKVEGKDEKIARGATIERWTFIVGKDGKIVFKNSKVNAAGDAKAVVEELSKGKK
jgi:peroxiredoxin Q/BCP